MWCNISHLIVLRIIFLQEPNKNSNQIHGVFEMVHNLNKMVDSASQIFQNTINLAKWIVGGILVALNFINNTEKGFDYTSSAKFVLFTGVVEQKSLLVTIRLHKPCYGLICSLLNLSAICDIWTKWIRYRKMKKYTYLLQS